MPIKTVNPATGETLKEFDQITDEQLESVIAHGHSQYQMWKATPFSKRAEILHNVATLMRQQKQQLAELITLEMGKLIVQSEGEIELSAAIYDYYADNGEAFLADQPLPIKDGEAFIRQSPIGVLLGVEPWNFPFYQVARFAAPNVMAGNVILLKHASNVPQCAEAIESLFKQAGAPVGVYTNIFLPGSKIEPLLADSRIMAASLTGSEAAGASLAQAAGKNLKKCVLELGGSDPFIVLEDADIDNAVKWAVMGRLNNTGQSCVASKRFILVETIADAFLDKFTAAFGKLTPGHPADRKTTLGPLSSENAVKDIAAQVQKAVDAGAKLLIGGKRIDRKGAFMEATIITDITPEMDIYHEELFGPVASCYRVANEAEAIKLANATTFGLSGSVFTADPERGKRVAAQIDSGMVFINTITTSKPNLPFGGTKNSGFGRELSELGIHEFINKKLIHISAESDPS